MMKNWHGRKRKSCQGSDIQHLCFAVTHQTLIMMYVKVAQDDPPYQKDFDKETLPANKEALMSIVQH